MDEGRFTSAGIPARNPADEGAIARARRTLIQRLRDLAERLAHSFTARNFLILITIAAFWWRLLYATDYPGGSLPGLSPSDELHGDEATYHAVATSLLNGDGYDNPLSASRETLAPGGFEVVPPLYPTLLAGVYAASDYSLTAVRILQAALSAATVIVIYLIGRDAFNRSTGLIAAVLTAIYPWFVFWPRLIYTETLFIFLFGLTLLAMIRATRQPSTPTLVLAGGLLALTNLTHASAVLIAPLFALYLLARLGPRAGLRASVLFAVAGMAVVAPWTIYNAAAHHALIPIASTGGINLYHANNPNAMPDRPNLSTLPLFEPDYKASLARKDISQIEEDRLLWRRAVDYIVDHPGTFFANGWDRVRLFWTGVTARPVFNTPILDGPLLSRLDHLLLVALLPGLALSLLRWNTAGLLCLVAAQSTVWHFFFPVMPSARSRVIIMTAVIVLAASALWAGWLALRYAFGHARALYCTARANLRSAD